MPSFMSNWYPTPTIGNHMKLHTPEPDYMLDRDWRWPIWKFGYDGPKILFTTLYAEFNSLKCAIQDPYGWHSDVCDVANIAKNKEEFLTLLKQRQKERFDEIRAPWEKTTTLLTAEPDRWDTPPESEVLWGYFIRLARNFSYDSLVGFFSSYVVDDHAPNPPVASTSLEARSDEPQQPSTQQPSTQQPKK